MDKHEMEIMNRIHEKQLLLLSEFDRICRKYKLNYYIAAGTLLGAVRHKDFIPWDDDIDVYLKRDEYEKFMHHIDEFSEPFEIYTPQDQDSFFWDFTTRLVYKKSKLKFDTAENNFYHHRNNEYLYLDIFVLDRTYPGLKSKIQLLQLKTIYGLAMSRRYAIVYSDYSSVTSKCQVMVLSHIGKLFSIKKLLHMYRKVQTKYANNPEATYEFPSNITILFLGKLMYKAEWHKTATELEIRGKKFLAPSAYAELLQSVYGNYMSLPPENDRKPDHINVLDIIEVY